MFQPAPSAPPRSVLFPAGQREKHGFELDDDDRVVLAGAGQGRLSVHRVYKPAHVRLIINAIITSWSALLVAAWLIRSVRRYAHTMFIVVQLSQSANPLQKIVRCYFLSFLLFREPSKHVRPRGIICCFLKDLKFILDIFCKRYVSVSPRKI